MRTSLFAFIGLPLVSTAPLAAITFGHVDTFQDGTTQGWSEGGASPNPPTNIATGGPAGAGDHYLRNVSSGGSGAGSKMTMFNQDQWTGNYTTAGVTRIEADLANLGNTALHMRIALENSTTAFSSTTGTLLPAGSGWHHLVFDINSASLTRVSGSGSLATVLGGVIEMRILSGSSPTREGDALVATLGVDNIAAVPEPVSLTMLAMGGLFWGIHRRRSPETTL